MHVALVGDSDIERWPDHLFPSVSGSTLGTTKKGQIGDAFKRSRDQIDDEGVAVVCASPVSGFYIPTEALSIFDGEVFAGNWTLTIDDPVSGDGGTFNSWCLIEILNPPPGPGDNCGANSSSPGTTWTSTINTSDIITVPAGAGEVLTDLNVYVDVDHTWVM